jgi:hypothetical protein
MHRSSIGVLQLLRLGGRSAWPETTLPCGSSQKYSLVSQNVGQKRKRAKPVVEREAIVPSRLVLNSTLSLGGRHSVIAGRGIVISAAGFESLSGSDLYVKTGEWVIRTRDPLNLSGLYPHMETREWVIPHLGWAQPLSPSLVYVVRLRQHSLLPHCVTHCTESNHSPNENRSSCRPIFPHHPPFTFNTPGVGQVEG